MELYREKLEGIDGFISGLIDQGKSVGFSIGIRSAEEKLFAKTYGKLEINGSKECNSQSLFCVGSLSKSFTAISILLLAERGKLSINDPISKYLPLHLNGREDQIQLKHLMSHSSGLPNVFICPIIEKKLGERADYNSLDFTVELDTWQDVFTFVDKHADFITSEPGERFHYSDTAFSFLQYIIEQVSGTLYHDFIKENIFKPLEMTRSTIRSQFVEDDNATRGHLTDKQNGGQGITATHSNYPISMLIDGGGGVMACNDDQQNYLSMMMNGGVFKGQRLMSESSYQQMIAPSTKIDPSRGMSYGYGWLIMEKAGKKFVFHPGNTGASTTLLGFVVGHNFGMFLNNNITLPPLPIYIGIMQMITDFSFDFSSDILSVTHNEFVGTYQGVGQVAQVEIINDDGDLCIKIAEVNVYGKSENYKPLYKAPKFQDSDEDYYYFTKGRDKVQVYLETVKDQQWVTVGIDKYKKNS